MEEYLLSFVFAAAKQLAIDELFAEGIVTSRYYNAINARRVIDKWMAYKSRGEVYFATEDDYCRAHGWFKDGLYQD
jgi:hypothetical protein